MAERNQIIVNHSGFSAPLLEELTSLGAAPVFGRWTPDDALLERSLACFVWFYDCLRHPVRIWSLKRRLRRHGVPLVAWNRDAPHYLNRKSWRLDLLDRARLLDIYATHTLVDSRTFADLVLYLPNAADVSRYHLRGDRDNVFARLRDPGNYKHDVSFIGAFNGMRHKELKDREMFFSALARRLAARNIRALFCEAEGMSAEAQVALVQESRINLNYGASCEFGAKVASGLPERCYGIPACGGFLLCDRRTHAADDFDVGANWAQFDGLDDCVAKIEYWLAHFDAARAMAEHNYEHVMAHHRYRHRALKLHEALRAWHVGKRGLIK